MSSVSSAAPCSGFHRWRRHIRLTITLGLLAAAVGAQTPVVIIAGFLPMFFAAYAYREFNTVMPDAGTSFTWTSKAFGPYIGLLGGWAAVVASVIVLSNLAGVAVQFLYQLIGSAANSEMISGLWENKLINVVTCLAFIAIATYVAYRGIDTTEHVQMVLVIFQLIMLLLFAVIAIAKSGGSEFGEPFSWSWFSPAGLTLSAFIAGLSGSIFAFWGWDTALTVNEESKNSDTTPGRAALLCVLSILLTYLLVAVATQMFAGVGDTGIGLANERSPTMSSATLPYRSLAIPSTSASLPCGARVLGRQPDHNLPANDRAPCSRWAHIRRCRPLSRSCTQRIKTPSVATFTAGIGAAAFYTVLTFLSESVLTDTISALGIMICFYYGLTAFGCIWFFRHTLFDNAFNFVFKFLFPLLGGLGLFVVFVITLRDSASPDYGSGASIGGVGLVLILGLGLILLGVVVMLIMRARQPEFFRGETVIHESAHAMRPHEHLVQ